MANLDVSPVPLFDRLVDSERWTPREARPYRSLDRAGLRMSISDEVARLLNTRCTLTVDQANDVAPEDRTVLDYGIPDISQLNPLATSEAVRLCNAIRNSLLAFEPRLAEPQVHVLGLDEQQRNVVIAVTGLVVTANVDEPFSFAISVQQASQAPVGESNAA